MTRSFSDSLRISEIFYSIQGESTRVGLPTTFIRLTGCPLRCQYCDTAYAFTGGKLMSMGDIIAKLEDIYQYVSNSPADTYHKYITVSGGEPLAQKGCSNLLTKLSDLGYKVSLETSGAFDIKHLDPRVMVVMDIKTPDSLESKKNLWENIDYLKPSDQIKFVICSPEDYAWSKEVVLDKKLYNKCEILFSPSYKEISLRYLADNIIKDNLPVRLQMQMHKQIWGEEQGR